jgi:glycosyltransferase involved in cell wall biosynthesis
MSHSDDGSLPPLGHEGIRKPLTIAHVLYSYQRGGAEQMAVDLATWQLQRGHRVLAIATSDDAEEGPRAEQFRALGMEALCIRKRPGMSFDPTLTPRITAALAKRGVTFVHTHTQQPLTYAAPAARLVGAPSVHTKHGKDLGGAGRLWLRRAGALCLSAFVAVSEDMKREAESLHEMPFRPVQVILNGIVLSRFKQSPEVRAAVREELGVGPDTFLFVHVGRLVDVKNQELLIRAAAPLLEGDARVVLVGDGPDRDKLDALVRELGVVDKVLFAGPRDDVPRVLAAVDAFTMCSKSEGLPLALLEAMASDLPVISTAVGGIPAVIDGHGAGLLSPAGEVLPYRRNLAALLADREAARRMGRVGHSIAQSRYSVDRMALEYMALYAAGIASPFARARWQ